jgi:uncharacterized protein with HEPN domain
MPRKHGDEASLFDMLQAARGVLRHTAGKTRDDYEREEILRDAVERKIEIIGEGARRLSDPFQTRHPQIPWRIIMATRHILAHDYDEVDNDIVWRIVTDHIPVLVEQLKALVPPHASRDE